MAPVSLFGGGGGTLQDRASRAGPGGQSSEPRRGPKSLTIMLGTWIWIAHADLPFDGHSWGT